MKVISVEKVIKPVYYVSTDQGFYSEYRRYEDGYWEIAMGESWEPVYNNTGIEMMFQEFLKLSGE